MSNKEAIAKSPSGRVRRSPVGVRNVLTVAGKDDNYHYRVVNDTGDRVQQFIEGGYETVDAKDVRVGDKRVNGASPEGSVATASVGGGIKGVIMRIPKEFYDEDFTAKMRNVDATEEATKQKAQTDSDYGRFDLKS